MDKNPYSRRKFMIRCLSATTAFFGTTWVLSSCNSGKDKSGSQEEKPASLPTSCDDLSGVSKTELEKRERLSYVTKTTVPGSQCNNCQLHIPHKYDENIGGCILFDGPVCPEGYCTQYVRAKT